MSEELKLVILMRTDLNMRKGKMIAQGAHICSSFILDAQYDRTLCKVLEKWIFESNSKKVVLKVGGQAELLDLMEKARGKDIITNPVYDMGLTEFHGISTLTCAGIGPDLSEKIDEITGHLELL